MDPKAFAEDVQALRRLLKWSQLQLSQEADVPRTTLRRIEEGRSPANLNQVKILYAFANRLDERALDKVGRSRHVSDGTHRALCNLYVARVTIPTYLEEFPTLMGRCIRRLRQERGMNLEELADQAGIASGRLSELERGLATESFFEAVDRIQDALGVELESLTLPQLRELCDEEAEADT